ncbi:hypothetical protein BJF78_22195 [Pseudonocardia sp. CNS-139]|nr:hypothetical protein BJF78_22195 [Pseudonocardia sp. CNS-139]
MSGALDLHWRKSSYSGDNGNCVELAVVADGRVAMRDSKAPAGGMLVLTPADLREFVVGVRAGEFDA